MQARERTPDAAEIPITQARFPSLRLLKQQAVPRPIAEFPAIQNVGSIGFRHGSGYPQQCVVACRSGAESGIP